MGLAERITALEATASGLLVDVADIDTQLGVTPTSAQVVVALRPQRADIDTNIASIDRIDIALAAMNGVIRNLAFTVKRLEPSGLI